MQTKISAYLVDRGASQINKSGVKKRKKIPKNKATRFPFLTRKYAK